MDNLTEVRPKLRQDSVFFQTQDGAFIRSDETAFLLKGKSIYRWLSALAPHMTGKHTLEEMCTGLEAAQRETVVRLVDTLLQRGVVKNHIPESSELLDAAVQKYFKTQIQFIDHFVDRPMQRFKTFRESRFLLIGSGESLTSLASTLMRNGARELLLASTHAIPPAMQSHLDQATALLRQHDVEIVVNHVDIQVLLASSKLGQFDLVVYCSDDGSLKDVLAWQERCLQESLVFLPAAICQGQAMLGPLVKAQGQPCWLCAQMRLATNAEEKRSAAIWRELILGKNGKSSENMLFVPQARRLGTGLAFEIFKIITQALPSETSDSVILQNLETLESASAPIVPHPLCPSCSSMDADKEVQRLQAIVTGQRDQVFATREEMLHLAIPLIHKLTGVFQDFTDDKLTQIPLKVSHIKVALPAAPFTKDIAVAAFSTETLLEARLFSLWEAIGRYTQNQLDTRAILTGSAQELEERGLYPIAGSQLTTWSGASIFKRDTLYQWSPAFALKSQHICYVLSAAVYSSSQLNFAHLFEKTTAGTGTATTFHDVVVRGTLSALAYEELQALNQGYRGVARLNPETLKGIDSTLTYLLDCASHFKQDIALLEVQTELPLHLILAYTTNRTQHQIKAVGVALSLEGAAKKALTSLVGQLQHLQYEGYLPELEENDFPFNLLREDVSVSESTSPQSKNSAATFEQLQHDLGEKGREILFVHQTTSDIWEKAPFISGRILLTRAPS